MLFTHSGVEINPSVYFLSISPLWKMLSVPGGTIAEISVLSPPLPPDPVSDDFVWPQALGLSLCCAAALWASLGSPPRRTYKVCLVVCESMRLDSFTVGVDS